MKSARFLTPNICIDFLLASFKHGFIYTFSTMTKGTNMFSTILIDIYLTRFKQGFIYTFYKDTKKNKQHFFDTIYCFKTILQHVQYAMAHILQKT